MAKRKTTPNPLDDLIGSKPSTVDRATPDDTPSRSKPSSNASAPKASSKAKSAETPGREEAPAGDAYERTSTGYVRGSGERVRRVSFFLTDAQRQELKIRAARAGFDDLSSYLVSELGL